MKEMKKDQEELFRTIYKIATDLVHAGHVAEWDFKSYVLGTMFYRYISENLLSTSIRANERPVIRTLTMPKCLMQRQKLPVRA